MIDHAIVLKGLPGSGKSDMSKIAKNFGYYHVPLGPVLMERYPELVQSLSLGHLAPDPIVIRLLEELTPQEGRVIFDGAPRTLIQSVFMFGTLLKGAAVTAVFLDLPEEKVIGRAQIRRNSGVQRPDDDPEVVMTRLTYYRHHAPAIIKHMKNACTEFVRIDANQSKQNVADQLTSLIGRMGVQATMRIEFPNEWSLFPDFKSI